MNMRRLALLACAWLALATVACAVTWTAFAQAPPPPAPALLLANASVVDVATGEVRRGQVVVVRDGRIESVGAAAGSRWAASQRPNASGSSATICSTLVCRPWPISVPPWFTCTLPSV